VLYPNTAGCKFDMNYYLNQHMPMVQQKLGPACKRMAVEEGIAGGAPGPPATYVAMGHLHFDSTDAFQTAFAPHAQAIMADIPNYTNTQPTFRSARLRCDAPLKNCARYRASCGNNQPRSSTALGRE
jgi:uncharacterized protein (TIGR02118 family)